MHTKGMKNRIFAFVCAAFCMAFGATPIWAQACRVVWAPDSQDLVDAQWYSGKVYKGGQDRIGYDADQDALEITQERRVKKQLSEYRPFEPWVKGNTAQLRVDFFIPQGMQAFNASRFAIGIRGGADTEQRKISGKATPDVQDGWSLRVNYNRKRTARVYAYNLNRAKPFGVGKPAREPLPEGEWITAVLEATLNTPGQENGFAQLTFYNAQRIEITRARMDNLVWLSLIHI